MHNYCTHNCDVVGDPACIRGADDIRGVRTIHDPVSVSENFFFSEGGFKNIAIVLARAVVRL